MIGPDLYARKHPYSVTCECDMCEAEYTQRQITGPERYMQNEAKFKVIPPTNYGRTLAGPDILTPLDKESRRPQFQTRALEGSGYVTREGEAWARRAVPKIKGKAAKKAAKKARQRSRGHTPYVE